VCAWVFPGTHPGLILGCSVGSVDRLACCRGLAASGEPPRTRQIAGEKCGLVPKHKHWISKDTEITKAPFLFVSMCAICDFRTYAGTPFRSLGRQETFRISSRRIPAGISSSTVSPARLSISTVPRGEAGDVATTVRSSSRISVPPRVLDEGNSRIARACCPSQNETGDVRRLQWELRLHQHRHCEHELCAAATRYAGIIRLRANCPTLTILAAMTP
jgi:hypothetical protein